MLLSVQVLQATTLTGSLLNPDGTGLNGWLILSLAQQASLSSSGSCGGPATIVPTVQKRIQVTSGALGSPVVYGNDCMLPQGTYYNVQVTDTNGNTLFTDRWVISGTSIDVGTIVSVVISGTTGSLGGIGFVQTAPLANQSVAQPIGTTLSINYLVASSTFEFPQGNVCDASGCNGMTFKTAATFNNGLSTLSSSSSTIYAGTGMIVNKVISGADFSCSGISDGFLGVRTDTLKIEICIGGVMHYTNLN
ncbi:MAG: hypothetical protein KGL39_22130 [Patescibacteria group bacterium]|nr:hypothetical protein [Patescibacteria group bacterium]